MEDNTKMAMSSHAAYERITTAKTVVLFVHGIQGSPLQFKWFVNSLPSNIDYKCILLPGHGGSVARFKKTGSKEWQRYINKLCTELRTKYERVVYVGHSMGCLLGINATKLDDKCFDAMLLLACPTVLSPTVKYFVDNFRAVKGSKLKDPHIEAIKKANSVYAKSPYSYLSCVRPYIGLFKLIAEARTQVSNLQIPIVLVHSEHDEIVSQKSLVSFRGLIGVKSIIVPASGHFLYSPDAKNSIIEELEKLIQIVE